MKEIQKLIKRVEVEINKTPTGELRNLLCDANIVLQQQALNIAVVSKAKRTFSLDFIKWYSGMTAQKILNAFDRYKRESGNDC